VPTDILSDSERDFPMDWVGDFLYQIVAIFLFAVAFGIAMYFLSEKDQSKFLVSAFSAWLFMGAAIAIYLNNRVLIEPETGGLLTPARDPNPAAPSSCGDAPSGAIRLYFGSSGLAFTTGQSSTIVAFDGDPVLQIKRQAEGISVNAKIFSQDKRIVAEIKNNRFTLNPNNYFRRERPDKHTLVVIDQEDREVLRIRYVNRLSVKLTGVFFYPRKSPIRIQEGRTVVGNSVLSDFCLGNNTTALSL
jgi:hypothetical protein